MTTYKQSSAFTKMLVLEHASRLLLDGGPPSFRMRDLAESLGVTIPYIYKHFKSREEIISEAYLFLLTAQVEREIALFQPPSKPFETAHEFFQHVREIVKDPEDTYEESRRLRLQGLAATLYDEDSEKEVALLTARHHDALVNLIHFAQSNGSITEAINPDLLAFIIISIRIGFVIQDVKAGATVTDDEVWELYEAAFLLLQAN